MNDPAISRRTVLGGAAAIGAVAAGTQLGTAEAVTAEQHTEARQRKPKDQNPVALVTGTSSGFGQLIALTLARSGHTVHASMRHSRSHNARAAHQLRSIARAEDLAINVVDIDVRHEGSVERGVRRVLRSSGRIDVLVNNAGIYYPALLETQTVDQVKEIFDTNVFGQLRVNRAVLPTMRRQDEGLVVQITSGVGRISFPFQGAYDGSKWALESLTEVYRYELSQSGVDVVMVEPGAYPTNFITHARQMRADYLRRLNWRDQQRLNEYGELASRAENELEEPVGPDPQEVADAVLQLVQTPAGQRPLRNLVGEDTALIGDINDAHLGIQNQIMGYAGYEDLISVAGQA
jgi:NAD(P)-dependent dehydrogenase (short-subunit alcohol dehydrogenase family)